MLNAIEKSKIVEKHRLSPADTGSSDVQIALITARIEYLTKHMQVNKNDNHTRRGLIAMVNKRRKLLDYLKKTNPARYQELINLLGLRK